MHQILCACGHSEVNHLRGKCSAVVLTKDDPYRVVLCPCEQFKASCERLDPVDDEIIVHENED